MADTLVASANVVQQWQKDFFAEYVRASQFKKYMGTDENSVIQLVEDLTAKAGNQITVSLIKRLSNSAITGDNVLEGNEEHLDNYGCAITIDQLRNGVRLGTMERIKTELDLLNAAKTMLKTWAMEHLRDQIIAKLLSPNVDGVTAYASTAEGTKDTWLAANSDRVLFGAAKGNNAANDHSAALLNVDSANDILQPAIVSLAKRMAKTANPHIRPIMVDNYGEWYILFANSLAFRDFKNHATSVAVHEYAAERGDKNPLFTDGDLLWDGVIIRECPEISVITGVGAGAIDVAPNFLCGAQAVGIAWGQRTKVMTDEFDYGNKKGVAISEIRGVKKLMFNNVQNGVLTLYTAGVADT